VPAFNAELAAKAQEKRLDAVEKLARELAAKINQDDTAVVLKKTTQDLTSKLDALETVVRGIVETRGETKVQALEKLVKLMHENMPKKAEIEKMMQEDSERKRHLYSSMGYVTTEESKNMIMSEMQKVEDHLQESRRKLKEQEDDELQRKLDEAMERNEDKIYEKVVAERKQREKEEADRLLKIQEEQVAKLRLDVEKLIRDGIDQQLRNQIEGVNQRLSAQMNVITTQMDAINRRLAALDSKQ
jgi:hypothetical protein